MSALYHELLAEVSRGAIDAGAASTRALKLDLARSRAILAAQGVSGGRAGVIGKLLYVRDGVIHGWAMDTAYPHREVPVNARLNGRIVATAIAGGAVPTALIRMLPTPYCATRGFELTCRTHRRWVGTVVDVLAGNGECELATDLRLHARGTKLRVTSFDGHCDPNTKGVATGWVWDTEHPEQHFDVMVLIDDAPVAWGTAGRYRADLAHAHVGVGDHAFAIPLPKDVFSDRLRSIEYVVAESGLRLPGGPLLIRDRHIFPAPKLNWRTIADYVSRTTRP